MMYEYIDQHKTINRQILGIVKELNAQFSSVIKLSDTVNQDWNPLGGQNIIVATLTVATMTFSFPDIAPMDLVLRSSHGLEI